jgi:hypothetical protein
MYIGDIMNRQIFTGSDFLFARPSFLEGIGRTIDLFGVMDDYNYSDTPEEADLMALKADISALRNDFNTSFSRVKTAHGV